MADCKATSGAEIFLVHCLDEQQLMCLGIPGRVVETFPADDMLMGKVDFGGVFKEVCLAHDAASRDRPVRHRPRRLRLAGDRRGRGQSVFALLEEYGRLEELRTPSFKRTSHKRQRRQRGEVPGRIS